MPAERVAMRQVREIIRLKFSARVPTREIARRLGIAASTVRGTLGRLESAGLNWPAPLVSSLAAVEGFFQAGAGVTFAAALKAGISADMLVEWQDLSGNTHISDALLHNTGAATASSTALKVAISDMVQVTGVIETGANLHLVA